MLFKLLLNVLATGVLVLYLPSIDRAATIAATMPTGLDELRGPTHVLHAGAALLVLLAATVLAVYKPRGMTRYGWRATRPATDRRQPASRR